MNDGGSQMRNVASRMDDEATAAVAAYFAQVGDEE
jgi:cytochrome c553